MSTWDRAALALQENPRVRCWVEYTAGDGSHYYYDVSKQACPASPLPQSHFFFNVESTVATRRSLSRLTPRMLFCQVTSWVKPSPEQLIVPGTEDAWIVCLDDKKRRYFHDVVNNVTSWKPPAVLKTAKAAPHDPNPNPNPNPEPLTANL